MINFLPCVTRELRFMMFCCLVIGLPLALCAKNTGSHQELSSVHLPQELESFSWDDICKRSQGAVCQVFCCAFSPDFVEPYLSLERSGGCRGSGFCISPHGLIITNYHVIDRAIALYVQFPLLGKNRYKVDYVGGCPDYDVALLKLSDDALVSIATIYPEGMPFVSLGDSDEVFAGQKLAAIGYPLGQENIKISSGICSGREEMEIDYIQSTIPINSGNSGGAVFNKKGEVIGISSSKIVGVGVEGVTFVIPINNVFSLLEQMVKNPVVRAPLWGIHYAAMTTHTLDYFMTKDELSQEAKIYFKEQSDCGVFVTHVKKYSLFERAGILAGDILLAVNNFSLDNFGYIQAQSELPPLSLYNYLGRLEYETELQLLFFRKGQLLASSVLIEQLPQLAIHEWIHWSEELPQYTVFGGLVMTELSLNLISDLARGILQASSSVSMHRASGILKYGKIKHRTEPRVCLSTCLPHSQGHKAFYRAKSPSDCVIKKINQQDIFTLKDVQRALLAGALEKYLVIETEGGVIVALPLQQVIDEEEELALQYGFTVSETMKTIKNIRAQGGDELLIKKDDGQT